MKNNENILTQKGLEMHHVYGGKFDNIFKIMKLFEWYILYVTQTVLVTIMNKIFFLKDNQQNNGWLLFIVDKPIEDMKFNIFYYCDYFKMLFLNYSKTVLNYKNFELNKDKIMSGELTVISVARNPYDNDIIIANLNVSTIDYITKTDLIDIHVDEFRDTIYNNAGLNNYVKDVYELSIYEHILGRLTYFTYVLLSKMFNKRTRVVINKWQKRINDKVSSFDPTLLILYGKHDLKYLHFRAVDDYLINDEHKFNESVHHIQDNNLTVVRFDKENLMFIKPDIVIRDSDYELLKTKVTTVDELYKFIMDREVILKFHNF